MNIENKVVDLVVESNVPFGMLLQFQDITTDNNGNITNTTAIDISGATFRGSIKDKLTGGTLLANLSFTLADPTRGILSMNLSLTQVESLAQSASTNRDRYNPRLREVGYYDVIMTRVSTGTEFRILEGKIYLSDGVTV